MCECVRISIKLYQYYDIICPLTNNLWHYKFSHVRLFAILQARILEWVAFPFSRGSSQPRDRIQVSRIAGGFFTSWTTRKAHGGWDSKESAWSVGDLGSIPVSGRSSGEGNGNPTSILAWRIPWTWDHKESDTTERLHFHFQYKLLQLHRRANAQCDTLCTVFSCSHPLTSGLNSRERVRASSSGLL